MVAPAGASAPDNAPLVEVEDLRVWFGGGRWPRRRPTIRAVDGVALRLGRGEALGLVGESGSGKSTLGRAIVQVQPVTTGFVRLRGEPLTGLSTRQLRPHTRAFQMVFQNPYGSLDPRQRVGRIVGEPLDIHRVGTRDERPRRIAELLDRVGLGPAYERRYPHELSGGQLQRVAIARALAAYPEFVVCDEAVSALDVSVQAQIVNLLRQLRDELQLALIFISHDLAVVRHIADRVAVMYLGVIVEQGTSEQIYGGPQHPYTRALISAVPVPDAHQERTRPKILLAGDIPSPASPPSGCRFRTRCPWAQDRCAQEVPALRTVRGHEVACHFAEDIGEKPFAAPYAPGSG